MLIYETQYNQWSVIGFSSSWTYPCVILWECWIIELSYDQTESAISAPITAMDEFTQVRHCWCTIVLFYIFYTNEQRMTHSSIVLQFRSTALLLSRPMLFELFKLKSMLFKVSWVQLIEAIEHHIHAALKKYMTIELSGYWAVRLLSCRIKELPVDLMVHSSDEIW